MSIESVIYTKLSGTSAITDLVSTRIYPGMAPQAAELPFITYRLISGNTFNLTTGGAGESQARYQFDAYATSYVVVWNIARAVLAALDGWRDSGTSPSIDGSSTHQSDQDFVIDPADGSDTQTFQVSLDFLIAWSN